MNTGCYARKLWAYKWIEKVARAPNKKLISLIQTKFFASCLLFISVMISNDCHCYSDISNIWNKDTIHKNKLRKFVIKLKTLLNPE